MTGCYDKGRVFVEGLDNLIIMKYDRAHMDRVEKGERECGKDKCKSSYVLLLYDLMLVQKMSAIFM